VSEFTWNITNTTRESEKNDSIVHVEWKCTCVDGGISKSVYGGVNLGPTKGSFISYNSVIESDVLRWIFSSPGVDEYGIPKPSIVDKQCIEDFVIEEINKKVTFSQGKPW